jgi:hypothetical protein
MSRFASTMLRAVGLSGILAALVMIPLAGSAGAAATAQTCKGTPTAPGVLAGTYPGNVVVKGACVVNAGPAVVDGNLTVAPGGALLAAFAHNDKTHKGSSSLTVKKNVFVEDGATLVLGCEAEFFSCIDDTGKPPTLQSRGTVDGTLFAHAPLGVIVHNSWIGGNVTEQAGGGGVTCKPMGVFKLFKSPVYSDYEDNAVGGSFSVTSLRSCWFGALRNTVHGSFSYTGNKLADPDASEVLHNYVNASMTCLKNHPAVQYGDSGSNPNVVAGSAKGQCSFHSLKPNPAPNGPLEPISVPAS